MELYISEILERVKKLSNNEEKANYLREHDSVILQQLLFVNFNSKYEFLLPSQPTRYTPSQFGVGLGDNNIFKDFRRLYIFYKGGCNNLNQVRREELWIQYLEGMSAPEALVMESLKSKRLEQDYGVTVECVKLAFPKLLVDVVLIPSIKFDNNEIKKENKKLKIQNEERNTEEKH